MLSYSTDVGSSAPGVLPYRSAPAGLPFVLRWALPNNTVMARKEGSSHILMGNPLLKSSKLHKQSVTSFSRGKELFCPYLQRKLKCWLQQSINRDDCRCLSFLLKLKCFMLTPSSIIFHLKHCLSNPELFYLSVS